MSRVLRVAAYEYRTNVLKRSFLLSLFSLPLILTVSIGAGVILESITSNTQPIGFVDDAGVITTLEAPGLEQEADGITVLPFEEVEQARAALEAGELQAYFILPADYRTTGEVRLVFMDQASEQARAQFHDLLRYNLARDYPPPVTDRIVGGTEITIRSPDGSRAYPAGGPTFSVALPLFVSAGFVFLLLIASGYAMGAVAGERESRTMEVLITSIPPGALIRGKLISILGISLTLLAFWTLVGIAAVRVGAEFYGIRWLQEASVEWSSVGAVLLIAVPNYITAIAIMVMVGSTVGELQEGQSLSGIFMLVFFLPLYAIRIIGDHPGGPLAQALSFLPFTSLLTVGIRNMVSVLPGSELLVSAFLQAVFAALAVWLAGRAFRIGILRIGQKVGLREVFRSRQLREEAGSPG